MKHKVILITAASVITLSGLVTLSSCTEEENPNPGGGTSASSSGSTSGGTSGTSSSSGTSGTSGTTSSSGTSGTSSGTSGNPTDSGSDAPVDSSGGNPSAKCAAYCTCMATKCPATAFAGGNCGTACAASGLADSVLQCRIDHCGYSASANDTTHCPHAVGIGACQ